MKILYTDTKYVIKKSLRYIASASLMIIGLMNVSCEDVLKEEVYSTFTTENFFTDVPSSELAMYGIYDALTSTSAYARDYFLSFQMGSDHARYWRTNRGLDDDLLVNYQISETNRTISNAWAALYSTVYRTNLVIDNVTELRDNLISNPTSSDNFVADLEGYNNVLGDAYFLRGFVYFQLVRSWGDVPLILSSNVSVNNLRVERDPELLVYEQIEKDMLYAISVLPDVPNVKSVGRISKTAAQGILSRVYLHWAGEPLNDRSKYTNAAEQALAVIESGYHQLNPNISKLDIGGNNIPVTDNPKVQGPDAFKDYFPEVFHNLANFVSDPKESMWELQYSYPGESSSDAGYVGTWHGLIAHTNSIYKRGAPRWYATHSFYNSFTAADSLRRDWSIATFDIKVDGQFVQLSTNSSPKWGVGKFRRYLQSTVSPNHNADTMNWPVIRYADVLLMYAEAVNEILMNGGVLPTGANINDAYEAVNKVRRRAMPFSPVSQVELTNNGAGEQFRQEIRDERSWELCFEKIRKPDLIRWGILGETLQATKQAIEDIGYSGQDAFFQADNFDESLHTKLPIPYASEISQNPDILNTDPTNNGYR